MDPTLLRAQLYSGSFIPGKGGPFTYSAPITAANSKNLVAAFNAGFRMQDANGGYYTQGQDDLSVAQRRRLGRHLQRRHDDRRALWGRDFTMNNQIASVRQNLDLIVDDGKPVPGPHRGERDQVGQDPRAAPSTSGARDSGVTKTGALVYVGGPALSISDLANVLVRAGAVRGMELDINTDWVQYSTYNGPLNTPINGGNGTQPALRR